MISDLKSVFSITSSECWESILIKRSIEIQVYETAGPFNSWRNRTKTQKVQFSWFNIFKTWSDSFRFRLWGFLKAPRSKISYRAKTQSYSSSSWKSLLSFNCKINTGSKRWCESLFLGKRGSKIWGLKACYDSKARSGWFFKPWLSSWSKHRIWFLITSFRF